MKHKILLIEKDAAFVEKIEHMLGAKKYEVHSASKYKDGYAKLRALSPDIVLLSLLMLKQHSLGDTVKTILHGAGMRGIPVVIIKDDDDSLLPPDISRELKKMPSKSVVSRSQIEKLLQLQISALSKQEAEKHHRELETITEIVDKWKDKKGNLVMILHAIQNEFGYVPRNISFTLSQKLNISLARIYEVITFYNFFRTQAPGKHIISVCMGTACYLKGAAQIVDEIKNLLHIEVGQTTEDGLFYLQVVRCLGCCGLAPVITIDDKVYGKLDKKQIVDILSGYTKKGEEANAETHKS